ncbi:unnamed protein product [Peronospora belbahrii]|nr:unnamed protein product [Peronospora belbahrii]
MFRTALKMWQNVVKYTTKPLLSQGVEGDVAMAKNSRRVFNGSRKKEEETHIAFEDKIKLITPDKVMLQTLSVPSVPVVALANWEAAPTFVLDKHLWQTFPKVSTDRLLNKCNPFLSGKGRAQSDDDIASETPTVSTDCSAVPDNDVVDDGQKVGIVNENVIQEKTSIITLEQQVCGPMVEKVSTQCNESNVMEMMRNYKAQCIRPRKTQSSRWICVGYGRYVKLAVV